MVDEAAYNEIDCKRLWEKVVGEGEGVPGRRKVAVAVENCEGTCGIWLGKFANRRTSSVHFGFMGSNPIWLFVTEGLRDRVRFGGKVRVRVRFRVRALVGVRVRFRVRVRGGIRIGARVKAGVRVRVRVRAKVRARVKVRVSQSALRRASIAGGCGDAGSSEESNPD